MLFRSQEESLWNYAKLSYEMRFDRDAVDALQKVDPRSPNYSEAQGLLGDILLNTRDYVKAMEIKIGRASCRERG